MSSFDSQLVDAVPEVSSVRSVTTYQPLDSKLIFANTEVKKTDYASQQLPYALGVRRYLSVGRAGGYVVFG